jgi:hypothetical protein
MAVGTLSSDGTRAMFFKRLAAMAAMAAIAAALVLPAQAAGAVGAPETKGEDQAGEPSKKHKAPEIQRDLSMLPAPVARIREQILEAAKSGDIERLRPILEANGVTPTFSFGGDADPIAFWKEASGDGEGREIMAILIEILESGFVHSGAGTKDEIYIWPYFVDMPLDKLTPEQEVELYELVTAQDVKDMREFGAYIFYRAGFTPDGQWQFFVAGD